jgi:hypothetical protein
MPPRLPLYPVRTTVNGSLGPPGDAPVNHYAFTLEAPLFVYRARHDAMIGA